jgi:hypothetical protein
MSQEMMIGIIGSLVLIVGAAWPSKKVELPTQSTKNWLFAVGGLVMLTYSVMNYLVGGSVFYIFLQLFVTVGAVLMMLNTPDKVDVPILSVLGLGFVAWSLYLFEGYNTIFFVFGLMGIAMGYAFEDGTVKRDTALTVGSFLIAGFSYMEASWIFFWLNLLFGIFSSYYLFRRWV